MVKYHKVISVGSDCQPAHYIRNVLKQQEAYFFDWLITPPAAFVKLLQHGPESLFYDRAQFQAIDESGRSHATVTHKGLGVVLFHEFPSGPKALNAFDNVAMKFRHLAQRWYGIPQLGRILFVRHYADKDESLSIQNAIGKAFPTLKFDLLVVNESDGTPWGLPGIVNTCVGPTTTDWKGDVAGWTDLLKRMVK